MKTASQWSWRDGGLFKALADRRFHELGDGFGLRQTKITAWMPILLVNDAPYTEMKDDCCSGLTTGDDESLLLSDANIHCLCSKLLGRPLSNDTLFFFFRGEICIYTFLFLHLSIPLAYCTSNCRPPESSHLKQQGTSRVGPFIGFSGGWRRNALEMVSLWPQGVDGLGRVDKAAAVCRRPAVVQKKDSWGQNW